MNEQNARTHIRNLMWDSKEEAERVAAECVCGRCDGPLFVSDGRLFSPGEGGWLDGWWLTLCSSGHVHNGVREKP